MRIKADPFCLTNDDPFKDDALNRKESIEILTQFIGTFNQSFVLGLNSPWGTGKTTFLKMWQRFLENKEFKTIYFNAWENDFTEDPLVALIGEIEESITEVNKEKTNEAIGKIKKIGSYLVKAAIPAAIKIATQGIIDVAKIDALSPIGDLAENIAREQIDNYQKAKCNIDTFRKSLADFVGKINDGAESKPLIFFIDELDRCRPDFALQLLEKVKHLFNIDGIVFVLALDKRQLFNSIKSVYGSDIDADGYLRRFIDVNYQLSEPEKEKYVLALFNKYGLNDYFTERERSNKKNDLREAIGIFSQTCSDFFRFFGFSLRIQEQCFSQFSIVYRATPLNTRIDHILLIILIALKNADQGSYYDYVRGLKSASDVIDFFKENGFSEENRHFLNIKATLIFYSQKDGERKSTETFYEKIVSKSNRLLTNPRN